MVIVLEVRIFSYEFVLINTDGKNILMYIYILYGC
jgi:hypothetical protein